MVKRARTAAKCSGMLNGFEGRLPTPLRGACALTRLARVLRTAPTEE